MLVGHSTWLLVSLLLSFALWLHDLLQKCGQFLSTAVQSLLVVTKWPIQMLCISNCYRRALLIYFIFFDTFQKPTFFEVNSCTTSEYPTDISRNLLNIEPPIDPLGTGCDTFFLRKNGDSDEAAEGDRRNLLAQPFAATSVCPSFTFSRLFVFNVSELRACFKLRMF